MDRWPVAEGRNFRAEAVRAVLRNSIYAGCIQFLNQEHSDVHEVLVTAELWEKANLAEKNVQSGWRGRHSYPAHKGSVTADLSSEQDESNGERIYLYQKSRGGGSSSGGERCFDAPGVVADQ